MKIFKLLPLTFLFFSCADMPPAKKHKSHQFEVYVHPVGPYVQVTLLDQNYSGALAKQSKEKREAELKKLGLAAIKGHCKELKFETSEYPNFYGNTYENALRVRRDKPTPANEYPRMMEWHFSCEDKWAESILNNENTYRPEDMD